MRTLIEICVCINFFTAGMWYAEEFLYDKTWKRFFEMVLLMFFGSFIFLFVYLYSLVSDQIKVFNKTFQISFWWEWYFGKGFRNLPEDNLYQMNLDCKHHKYTNSLKHRIFRKAVNMINERNKYTFIEKEPEI